MAVNSVLAGARMVGSSGAYSILAGARMVSSSGLSSVLAGARMVGGQPVTVDAGQPSTLDPFQLGALSAVVPTGTAAGTWAWEFVSSTNTHVTAVAITQAGATATYETPATLDGVALTFRARYQMSGQPDSTATVAHTIRPHWLWKLAPGGVYVPVQMLSYADASGAAVTAVTATATATALPPSVSGAGSSAAVTAAVAAATATALAPSVSGAAAGAVNAPAAAAAAAALPPSVSGTSGAAVGAPAATATAAANPPSVTGGLGLGLAPLGTSPLGA